MDKINKFLLKLNEKERSVLLRIFGDIKLLNVKNYDVKPLKGHKNLWRLRKGKIRVIFTALQDQGVLLSVGFRKDIYK